VNKSMYHTVTARVAREYHVVTTPFTCECYIVTTGLGYFCLRAASRK
jgi:hypothetical protein